MHGHFSDNTAKITLLNLSVVFASLTDFLGGECVRAHSYTHTSSNRQLAELFVLRYTYSLHSCLES